MSYNFFLAFLVVDFSTFKIFKSVRETIYRENLTDWFEESIIFLT